MQRRGMLVILIAFSQSCFRHCCRNLIKSLPIHYFCEMLCHGFMFSFLVLAPFSFLPQCSQYVYHLTKTNNRFAFDDLCGYSLTSDGGLIKRAGDLYG